ncbi:MAG: MaoC family dehydratase, partial [Candidatus Hodarchaeota archaeon]
MKAIGRSISEFEVGMQREFKRRFIKEDTEFMAELIGDHNPFHFEGEFIKKTRFKEPIVHGMLIGGMICHFGGDIFPGPGYLAEEMKFKFLKPVYFGEEIRAVGTVVDVDTQNRRVKFSMDCFNEKGDKVFEGYVVGIP